MYALSFCRSVMSISVFDEKENSKAVRRGRTLNAYLRGWVTGLASSTVSTECRLKDFVTLLYRFLAGILKRFTLWFELKKGDDSLSKIQFPNSLNSTLVRKSRWR